MFRGRFMETRLTILENISSLNRVGRDEWRLKKIVPIWHGILDSILLRWILEGVLLISIQVNWWKTKLRCNKLKSSSVNCVCDELLLPFYSRKKNSFIFFLTLPRMILLILYLFIFLCVSVIDCILVRTVFFLHSSQ